MPAPKRTTPKLTSLKPPHGLLQKTPTKTSPEPAKKFAVKSWDSLAYGEKIVGYGDTGLGKTTLFTMLPNSIFIGLDDGGRRIINPKTGKPNRYVPGIQTFEDVRAALQQPNLFPKGSSCIIDTLTLLETLAGKYVLDTIRLPKTGGVAKNLKAYGWNEGSSHVLDAMRLILQDLDGLVRRGVNVGLICQEQTITIANAEGLDYLQACPKLHHDRQYSVMLDVCAWADHVFRIDYLNSQVRSDGENRVGKIIDGGITRAIYIQGAPYFRAKSRTLGQFMTEDNEPMAIVAFERPDDESLWTFIFQTEDSE